MKRPFLVLVAITAACGHSDRAGLATAVIDTLPGGVIRVSNPGPTEWSDTTGWRLVADLTITGSDSGPGQLNQPWMLAVDQAGRVYVSDQTIKLFGPDGHFIRSVGRLGEGPGEYRDVMLTVAGDDLVVEDPTLGRLTVFDSAGHYLRSWHTICCHITAPATDTAGRIIVWTTTGLGPDERDTYIRYDLDGSLRDTLVLPPNPQPRTWHVKAGFGGFSNPVPFTPTPQKALPPAGGVVHGWPTEYSIVWARTGRDTALLFGRPWTPTLIPQERREGAVNYLRKFYTKNQANFGGFDPNELDRVMNVAEVPTTAPAYVGLEVDRDGNFWVAIDPGEDSLRSHYDVFDAHGVYRGLIIAPVVFKGNGRTVWTFDAVYSIQETAQGLPVIVRYRIEKL